jgi:hypothetical protein
LFLINGNKKNNLLTIGLAAIVAVGVLATIMPSRSAFADTICKGEFACAAIGGPGGDGGEGGRGGDTGDAIAGDIGPGGSCLAISATIGDNCGGSTGSSEPHSGSGDNSMNGGQGGDGGQGRDANVDISG